MTGRRKGYGMELLSSPEEMASEIIFYGGSYASTPIENTRASIRVRGSRVDQILDGNSILPPVTSDCAEINLSGFLMMPGFINAHDHLEFSLYPRLANPPYRNYIDWGEDIHNRFADVVAMHRAVPKDLRLWWGGIRNLLCGATTVAHHNPLWPELRRKDFPVKVISEYGWAHSLALGGDLCAARSATPDGGAFIVHACEGVDEEAREELWGLDRLTLLDASTVLVHGLAIDRDGVSLMRERQASLIVCPSSNEFLFGRLPELSLLGDIGKVALGNDSPLTAEGDLLDEIRFAMRYCDLSPQTAYRMVTEAPAVTLRLRDAEGSIKTGGTADLIAVRDTGDNAADRLQTLSMIDVEFVMINGRVQLASDEVLKRLPSSIRSGLEPLCIGGMIRWLRAPVKDLLRKTEVALGKGRVRLRDKTVRIPV